MPTRLPMGTGAVLLVSCVVDNQLMDVCSAAMMCEHHFQCVSWFILRSSLSCVGIVYGNSAHLDSLVSA